MSGYLAKANLLFELARYAEAVPLLREALVENPNDPLAHAMLGVACSRLGRWREAHDETTAAIGLGPTEPYCFYARSLVFIRTGHSADALWAIQEAIRLDSRSAEYYSILGALLFDKRQWNRALAALDQALAIEPDHVRSLNLRSRTLLELGRGKEAQETMDAAVAASPENADAHHARGVMLLTRAQTDEALDHLLEARRLNPLASNDADSIALAVGWRLPPFRWIGRQTVHWNHWPHVGRWLFFTALMLMLIGVRIGFPRYSPWRALPALFGRVTLNALVLPFTLDALATLAARLVRRRLVGVSWERLGGRVFVVALLHVLATALGVFSPVVMLVCALCAPGQFTWFGIRHWVDRRAMPALFKLVALPLAILIMLMMSQIASRPDKCLVTTVVFAVLAFFSDGALRWARRHEP